MEIKVFIEEVKAMLDTHKKNLLTEWEKMTADNRQQAADDIAKLETRIKEMETILTPRKVSLHGVDEEKEKFSFFKAAWAIRTNDWSQAGFERTVFDETRKKAMGAYGAGSAGAYIVPAEYIAQIIELLTAETVVLRAGATNLTALTGSPVQIPSQTGGSTGYWVAENSDITPSDVAVGQIAMTPKKAAVLVKLSNSLIKLSNPSAEALVRMDIARTLALMIDYAALRGSGAAGQPLGINGVATINTVAIGADGGNASFDTLIDMEYALAEDNALRGKLGYIFHPALRRKLLKLRVAQYSGQTDGAYIVAPVSEAQLQAWIQYPYFMTTQVPINLTKGIGTALTEIYFGNWAELMIGQWGGMEMMASAETNDAFQKDQTWIRILQEVDVAPRHGQSFCLCNDAKAT